MPPSNVSTCIGRRSGVPFVYKQTKTPSELVVILVNLNLPSQSGRGGEREISKEESSGLLVK